MYVIVRSNTYHPTKLAVSARNSRIQKPPRSHQPGYRLAIVVDAGNGRWLTVNLWESESSTRPPRSQRWSPRSNASSGR